MITKMKRAVSHAILALSLLVLLILACGYVLQLGVERYSAASNLTKPDGHLVSLTLEEGRVKWWSESSVPAPRSGAGVHFVADVRPLQLRRPARALWEFDAHALPAASAASSAYMVACPIWCAALPALIAPGLWLWKRYRRRGVFQGFDVFSSSEPATGAM